MVEAKEEWLFTKESSAAESNILEESGKELEPSKAVAKVLSIIEKTVEKYSWISNSKECNIELHDSDVSTVLKDLSTVFAKPKIRPFKDVTDSSPAKSWLLIVEISSSKSDKWDDNLWIWSSSNPPIANDKAPPRKLSSDLLTLSLLWVEESDLLKIFI